MCVLMFYLLNNTVYCVDYIVRSRVFVCMCVCERERERMVGEVLFNSLGSF